MKTSPEFFTALAERLGWTLLHSLWQGALIALVLAVALHWLRRNRAATRHAVCLFAMMLLAASVAGTAWRIRPAFASAHGSRPLVENAARGGMQAEPPHRCQLPIFHPKSRRCRIVRHPRRAGL